MKFLNTDRYILNVEDNITNWSTNLTFIRVWLWQCQVHLLKNDSFAEAHRGMPAKKQLTKRQVAYGWTPTVVVHVSRTWVALYQVIFPKLNHNSIAIRSISNQSRKMIWDFVILFWFWTKLWKQWSSGKIFFWLVKITSFNFIIRNYIKKYIKEEEKSI